MVRVAHVVPNIPTKKLNRAFTYMIPNEMNFITIGWRVIVPFGKKQSVEGFIIGIDMAEEEGLKSITDVLDEFPWFDKSMLALAAWMSEYYMCSLAESMRLFIPGKSGLRVERKWKLTKCGEKLTEGEATPYNHIYTFIQERGPATMGTLEKNFGRAAYVALQMFMQKNWISSTDKVQLSKKTILRQAVFLKDEYRSMSLSEWESLLSAYQGKKAQYKLLCALKETSFLWAGNLANIGSSPDAAKRLAEKGITVIESRKIVRDSYVDYEAVETFKSNIVQLNEEQEKAVFSIASAVEAMQHKSYLLHGVTGSGKTEVYMRAAEIVRKNNRQVIVLVPEIALTGQLVSRFQQRFGKDVVVLHSRLSVGERHDTWERIRNGDAGIVIGTRSAIFAPCLSLGMIVLDEEHEFTYKQEESPYYHAREIALQRGKFSDAVVILGSATPAIESYYASLKKQHNLMVLNQRVDGATLPATCVVDMRQELKNGRKSMISRQLQQLLEETIEKKEQAILLINRRGFATFVLCRECGTVIKCPHCSTSLVYHVIGSSLRCHYCGYHEGVPQECPKCQSRYIRYFGTGTQKIEDELNKLFPNARVIRMDQDTTGTKHSHDRILRDFSEGKYDILLGTQMVAKGHDIRAVTAVGILAADSGLHIPDFRAAERVFSLITQASGRAGRGDLAGRVVIQSYNPDHYAVCMGANHNYIGFYEAEIEFRKALQYPPFSQLVKIVVTGGSETYVEEKSEEIAAKIQCFLGEKGGVVTGPFVPMMGKVHDEYRMIILVKLSYIEESQRVNLSNMMLECMAKEHGLYVDVDPLTTF